MLRNSFAQSLCCSPRFRKCFSAGRQKICGHDKRTHTHTHTQTKQYYALYITRERLQCIFFNCTKIEGIQCMQKCIWIMQTGLCLLPFVRPEYTTMLEQCPDNLRRDCWWGDGWSGRRNCLAKPNDTYSRIGTGSNCGLNARNDCNNLMIIPRLWCDRQRTRFSDVNKKSDNITFHGSNKNRLRNRCKMLHFIVVVYVQNDDIFPIAEIYNATHPVSIH